MSYERVRRFITSNCAIVMAGMVLQVGAASSKEIHPAYKTNEEGRLVPCMTYARFLDRTFRFVLEDLDNGWASGNAYKDEQGRDVPAYVNYAVASPERRLGVSNEQRNDSVVYPALHHSLYIRAFLAHYRHTGDNRCLARAQQLADWNLARRTPADWKYGSLFYSTVYNGQVGGSVDGDAVMTDKPAIMALGLLELFDATNDPRYRDAAEAVAETLAKTQTPAGNWPFRVNPQTGEVREQYTSSVIYAVMLFEELDKPNGNRWQEPKEKALRWILEGPVKDMVWNGYYEDVSTELGRKNRTNWDCIDTARWLIAHRADNPEFLALARKLHDWVAREFVEKNPAWAPAEGLREQTVCFATMGGHTVHWAALLADFHEATGDETFKQRALDACALVTYWMRNDGANLTGPTWGDQIWFSGHFCPAVWIPYVLSRLDIERD